MSAVLDGLAQMAAPSALIGLVLGSVLGLLAGLTPGISGRVGLVMVTPIALTLGPAAGAVFLISFHSVVHTSGSIPAILFGTPTSAAEAATAIDGHAMARKGEGDRATGAALMASVLGGVIGAAFLFLAVGPALAVIRQVGSPEIAALSVLGLVSIAFLSDGRPAAGLMSAGLGLLIGTVGLDPLTGADRFTFGALGLWDGVSAAAVVTGLFVVPELLAIKDDEGPGHARAGALGRIIAGGMEVFRHQWLVVRTALIGIVVGLVPGLGVSGAVWLAYGHARQSHPSDVPYGEGAIAGVIAPEVANNAKEGGSLVPTLFLGIPGSSGMAILLASLIALGLEPGPRLLEGRPDLIALMAWSNVLSNVLAAPVCLLLSPLMVRLAGLPRQWVAPVGLGLALTATAMTAPGALIWAQLAVFSALGILLARSGVPRAPLLLGFVLGPGLETTLMRSVEILGWSALARPGVILILTLVVVVLAFASREALSTKRAMHPRPGPIVTFSALLSAAALLTALTSFAQAALAVAVAAVACMVGALSMLPRSSPSEPLRAGPPRSHLVGFALCLAGGALSPALSVAIYVAASLWRGSGLRRTTIAATGIVVGLIAWGLQQVAA